MTEVVKDKIALSQPCEKVDPDEVEDLYSILRKEVKRIDNSLGLAANQIGIQKQAFIIKNPNDLGFKFFVNPKILFKKDPFIFKNEGCLSFPDVYIDTVRYNFITVDDDYNKKSHYSNMTSVIIQHECEHLSGKTFFESQVPNIYDKCFCGSGDKFKFCCLKKLK